MKKTIIILATWVLAGSSLAFSGCVLDSLSEVLNNSGAELTFFSPDIGIPTIEYYDQESQDRRAAEAASFLTLRTSGTQRRASLYKDGV